MFAMASLPITLLLVENSSPDRELYRQYLCPTEDSSYRLLEAETVRAGLEFCRTEVIDAILLDYLLPDATGLQFLESLRAQSHEPSPPVVMVTGVGNEKIAVQAMKLGAEDYLVKRCLTPERLQLTVRSAIENARLRLQLRQQEQQFRISVENMLDCFGIYSALRDEYGQILDFRIDYMNVAALEANRMTRMAIGRGLCELLPNHRETGLFDEYCQVVDTGRPLIKESLIYSDQYGAQHLTRAFDIRASKLGDGFVASWRDVTEQKRSQTALEQQAQRLRDSETQLQVGVNVAGVALARFNYPTNTVQLTPEVASMYGLPADQLTVTRDRLHATFHPEERDMMAQTIAQVLDPAGDGWFARDHRVVWPNGEVRWLTVRKQVFFQPVNGELRPDSAILAALDITDRKQTELERDQLLAEAQAARAGADAVNRSKDEFVAMVAHELRSPLNSILGWAKLLRTRQFNAETTAKALETIERNTLAQTQLVEDLLDISRMVSGKLSIITAPVNLMTVIEAAIDQVRLQAEAKHITLDTQLPLPPLVAGDYNRLQQVVVNLLTNAIKFTPEQGQIDVELTQIETQVQLKVRDTGKGIAAEVLPYVFERFHQGQQNVGAKDGLGLGLAIVKNLVELHEGTITAASPGVGLGATFTVCLPMLSTPAITPERTLTPIHPTALAAIRILVVDDEPDMLHLIRFVLEECGAVVQTTSSLTTAIALFPVFEPDLLLSDIAMPEGSGYDLVQALRQYELSRVASQGAGSRDLAALNAPIPAIALTAYASASYEERSLQAGFQKHLTKPVEPEVLVAAIADLVRLRR
jgi:signal transduction histidine kinase/CheY-like chemotaxis protein